ncbi:hypothetical protein OPQ81_001747 [Rhizoctonia solani]|nr:hypothetical protein OPQ81_001747 [Rhizoctonia solani]
MNSNNNHHVNGVNNILSGVSKPYRLLDPGEDINTPNIRWLQHFSKFLQRSAPGGTTNVVNWICNSNHVTGNGVTWVARLSINGHTLDELIGQGKSKREAKNDLVRQLEDARHDLLHIPLLPQYHANPPTNGNALVNGSAVVDDHSGPVDAT